LDFSGSTPSSPGQNAYMADTTVFIVSDNPAIRDSLSELIASAGLRAKAFPSLELWPDTVQPKPRDCVVLDARVRDFTDPERFARLAATCTRLPVLLLVDRGDVPIAVRGITAGAVDVLEKPLRDASLLERIKTAAAAR
jgi:FixJ family two-component response regulator